MTSNELLRSGRKRGAGEGVARLLQEGEEVVRRMVEVAKRTKGEGEGGDKEEGREEEGGRGEGSQHNGLNIKYKSVFQIEGNLVGTFNGTHGGRKEICLPFSLLSRPPPLPRSAPAFPAPPEMFVVENLFSFSFVVWSKLTFL